MEKIHHALIFAFLLISFPIFMNRTIAASTVMRVEPASVENIPVGNSFTINLTVTDASLLFTWQITLLYNSTVLNCSGAVYPADHIFAGHGYIPTSPVIDNVIGSVAFGASLIGADIVSGSGRMCQITFNVVGVGTSGLDYSIPYGTDTFLLDGDLNVLSASTENGFFTNAPTPPPTRHDIAVTGLSFSNNTPLQGESIVVTVIALNNGTVAESTFDVNVSNGTTLLGTETVVNLAAGDSKTLTFSWNTSGAPLGQNTITANATTVPGETDLGNNVKTGTVTLVSSETKSADINGDGKFDMWDIGLVCWSFATHPGDARWRESRDISGQQDLPDGTIDEYDIAAVVKHFWNIP